MNTAVNPTVGQIRDFCKLMEEHLVAAAGRGSLVEIGFKVHTEEVFDSSTYGNDPVFLRHGGESFTAKFREQSV